MVEKHVICPDRLRRIPKQFSWVDHSLVRDKHICGLSRESLALYLFLVTVSDAEGLSYYSDAAVQRYLDMDGPMVDQARHELCEAGLIAYRCPLYQVLSLEKSLRGLPAAPCEHPRPRAGGEPVALGNLLTDILGGIR